MNKFFNESLEQSQIKSLIVLKYFGAWSKIMARVPKVSKIGYIDLYSGPGYYEDGTESTPIKILKLCISNKNLHNKIVTIFNDKDPDICKRLNESISSLNGIELLDNTPIVNNVEITDLIANEFKKMNMIPCFSFIDPFGYKGLSCTLINALIKDWGCDCVFFFNFNRINAAITNSKVSHRINSIFGTDVAEILRNTVSTLSPLEREALIIDKISYVLSNNNTNYVLPFKFISSKRNSTSHYLIFISKHILGYEIMKEIMCSSSSEHIDGVGSFSYIPTKNKQLKFLFNLNSCIDNLSDMLLHDFSGKTLTMKQIYDQHNVGTPFIKSNYKKALLKLESNNQILTYPPAQNRIKRKGKLTMSDKVLITF